MITLILLLESAVNKTKTFISIRNFENMELNGTIDAGNVLV